MEQWVFEPELGIVLPTVVCLPTDAGNGTDLPAVIVIDEAGKQRAFERGLVHQLVMSGHVVLAIDYRGTGETSETVPQIAYGAGTPEYNLSNYGLFLGRPISGMRVHDVRCATDFLEARPEVDAQRISICGYGRGGFVGMMAATFDERIHAVIADEMLESWVFNEEFMDIGLSYLIPRVLTLADMPQLIACVCPRPVQS